MVANPRTDMIVTLPMSDISHQIWDMKYRLKAPDGTPVDRDVADSWTRVALALAEAEAPDQRVARAPGIRPRPGGAQIPAGRTHPGGRRHGAQRHPVQLFCDGHHRRIPWTEFFPPCARRR